LSAPESLRAMLAVVTLLVESSMPDSKGEEPDEEGYPGPPSWWLGVRLTTSHRKN
jgi:hypothetical protein